MIFVNLQRFVAGPCLFLSKGEVARICVGLERLLIYLTVCSTFELICPLALDVASSRTFQGFMTTVIRILNVFAANGCGHIYWNV